jgi:hypothetical protein
MDFGDIRAGPNMAFNEMMNFDVISANTVGTTAGIKALLR